MKGVRGPNNVSSFWNTKTQIVIAYGTWSPSLLTFAFGKSITVGCPKGVWTIKANIKSYSSTQRIYNPPPEDRQSDPRINNKLTTLYFRPLLIGSAVRSSSTMVYQTTAWNRQKMLCFVKNHCPPLCRNQNSKWYCGEPHWGAVLPGNSLTLAKDKGSSRNLTLEDNKEVGYGGSKLQARFWTWTRK